MENAQQIIDNLNKNLLVFQAYVEQELMQGNAVSGKQITSKCKELGIDHNRFISRVKEAIEISLMRAARAIATDRSLSIRQRYDDIIGLYNRQPVVGAKMTLNQMTKEQYSTSLPVAYLMSEFVKDGDTTDKVFFEPSAGNGFLTIALPQEQTICNEIDENRLANLRCEHYRKVTDQDALQPFAYDRIFDGVVTNPPFLKSGGTEKMIFNALATMKDDGRCAIIRDGWNQFENYYGTMQRSKFNTFYDRLFTEYNVVKIINLHSYDVYAKQGTGFPMQLILIVGRNAKRRTDTKYRVFNPDIDKTEKAGFEKLWEYFEKYFPLGQRQQGAIKILTFRDALKLKVTRLQQMSNKDEWNCNSEAERINRLMARHIFDLYRQNMLTIENDHFKPDDTLLQWNGQPIPHRAALFKKEIELLGKTTQEYNILTNKDIETLMNSGYREKDLAQIDEVAKQASYMLANMPETEDNLEKFESIAQKVTLDFAEKYIDRKEIINGLARLAFHGWSGSVFRGNQNWTLELSMPRSYWFGGVEGVDDECIERIGNLHKAADTINKWVAQNKNGTFNIKLPQFVETEITKAIGRSVDVHRIDSKGIRHSIKNHGIKGKKIEPTDIPVRDEYYMLIPYIMVCPDFVEKGSADIVDRESVRFVKRLSNGDLIVVEKESLNDPNVFETVNMWGKLSDVVNAPKNPNIHVQNVPISTSDIAKIIQDAEMAIIKDNKNETN